MLKFQRLSTIHISTLQHEYFFRLQRFLSDQINPMNQ